MAYFDQDYIDFLQGLKENNVREWFHENKKLYDKKVKDPFHAFTQDLIFAIKEFDPTLETNVKESVFRINRDIRFSKDKTPYKTHMSAGIATGGKKSAHPGYYIFMGADSIGFGGGLYWLEKEDLTKVRDAIAQDPGEVVKIVSSKPFKTTFKDIKGDAIKRIPAEYKEAYERSSLIAHKNFYYMVEFSKPEMILKEDFFDKAIQHFKIGFTFNEFLRKAIGRN